MANKVNKDGLGFQRHLYYFFIGVCHHHKDCNYSILYEGNYKIYGAWDDVIFKEESPGPGLFFFQAKQAMNANKVISLDDVFGTKDGIVKYMKSFGLYLNSTQFQTDGAPNELIYWTSLGVHETTSRYLLQPCEDSRLPLKTHVPDINMYRIKDWKTMSLLEIAWKLAKICNPKTKSKHCAEYICSDIANGLAGEILEADEDGKVKFREAFLLEDAEYFASASNHVRSFRKQFQLACRLQQRNNELDIKNIKGITFEEKLFGLQQNWSGKRADSAKFELRYEHNEKTIILDEDKLEQFFQAFRYYTNVPKGEDMRKILNEIFDGCFDPELFETHLVGNPVSDQTDRYIGRLEMNSLVEVIKLKKQYITPRVSGVEFTKESSDQLRKCLKEFVDQKAGDRPLNIVAPYVLDWTAYRVEKELHQISNCIVIRQKDVPLISDKLSQLLETHIESEMSTIVVVGVNSFVEEDMTKLHQKVKRIILISSKRIANVPVFEDELSDEHVLMNFKEFEGLNMILDGRSVPLHIDQEQFKSVQKRAELYKIKSPIVMKSDLDEMKSKVQKYATEEQLVTCKLKDDQQAEITNEQLKDRMQNRVTVIVGPVGQGKTIELLRIAGYLNEGNALCALFRARTIADNFRRDPHQTSVSFNDWEDFIKLLQISPSNDIAKGMVAQHLAQNDQLYVLVDGLEDRVKCRQDDVISVIRSLIALKPSISIIFTASEQLISKLKTSFHQADFYHLNQTFNVEFVSELSQKDNISNELVIENVRQIVEPWLKWIDLSGFRWSPDLSSIPNNRISFLYNALIAWQFDSSVHSFDRGNETHQEAIRLLENEFYEGHGQMAYEMDIDARQVDWKKYWKLVTFGLVYRNPERQGSPESNLEFVHESVQTFFKAWYYVTHEVKVPDLNKFFKQMTIEPMVATFVDTFLENSPESNRLFRAKVGVFFGENEDLLDDYIEAAVRSHASNVLCAIGTEGAMEGMRYAVQGGGEMVQDVVEEGPSSEEDLLVDYIEEAVRRHASYKPRVWWPWKTMVLMWREACFDGVMVEEGSSSEEENSDETRFGRGGWLVRSHIGRKQVRWVGKCYGCEGCKVSKAMSSRFLVEKKNGRQAEWLICRVEVRECGSVWYAWRMVKVGTKARKTKTSGRWWRRNEVREDRDR